MICALIYNDANWRDFLSLAGQGDLFETDPRFSTMATRTTHIDELYGLAAEIFVTRTTAEWVERLKDLDIPVGPYVSIDDLCDDPHLWANGSLQKDQHPSEGEIVRVASPVRWREGADALTERPAPRLGAHSRAVLADFGFSVAEIDHLVAEGVLIQQADAME
jgi:crotonobetainyl-CoA:carnitine CoA-transferase CaiB-like acyl-CoA transferase